MGEGCRLEDIYIYIHIYIHTSIYIYIYIYILLHRSPLKYYTALPLNLANKQQAINNKHVTVPFWPSPLPIASGLTLL